MSFLCLLYLRHQVLIDTWWNVNYIQQSKILNPNKVLIDTWWNVNNFFIAILSIVAEF